MPQGKETAVEWYARAAEQGVAEACIELAELLESGKEEESRSLKLRNRATRLLEEQPSPLKDLCLATPLFDASPEQQGSLLRQADSLAAKGEGQALDHGRAPLC